MINADLVTIILNVSILDKGASERVIGDIAKYKAYVLKGLEF